MCFYLKKIHIFFFKKIKKDINLLKTKQKRTESNKEVGKHNRCDDNLYTWLGIVSDIEE